MSPPISSIIKSSLNFLPHDFYHWMIKNARPEYYKNFQQMRVLNTKEQYSFKPFDEGHCIFVHIPKVAGVSLCKSLFGNLAGGHTTIMEYRHIFKKAEMQRYFKFTFVRNPWDRLVSAFYFLKNGGMNDIDKQWAARNLNPFKSFDQFVQGLCKKRSLQNQLHFIPQHKFICTPWSDEPQVDYVGFYENIQNDFDYVCQQLHKEVKLNQVNKTSCKSKDYREYYTNETKEMVAKLYGKDVEIFGYDFDNTRIADQIIQRNDTLKV